MLEHARADRGEPAEQRRGLAQDRLVALRAGRDQAEGHADQLLEPLEVAARLRRQIDLILIAAHWSRTSSLVRATVSRPLTRTAYRSTIASNQPQRRGRPVTEPYSLPRAWTCSAILPDISAGNGPPPTRVVYALATPSTPWMRVGGTPVPVAAPPAVVEDDVMKG